METSIYQIHLGLVAIKQSQVKKMFNYLNDFMSTNFLKQHISQATHKDGNTLHLVLTNNHHLIHSYDCIIPPLSSVSDHYIVECKSTLGQSTLIDEIDNPDCISLLDKLKFINDIDWEKVRSSFTEIDWNAILLDKSPEKELNIIFEKICKICKDHYSPKKDSEKNRKG